GRRRGYDVVILDECSQIVEPMSLLPMAVAQPRRVVLVGDPMQLPPPVAHAKASIPTLQQQQQHQKQQQQQQQKSPLPSQSAWLEKANARRGNGDTLEKTLFVRLAKLGVAPLLLGRQYRCHPLLSALASRLFYQGRLTDGIVAADRPPLVPGLAPLTLVDAAGRGAEITASGGSIRNVVEAQAVAMLVASLLRGGSGSGGGGADSSSSGVSAASIGVICLYKAQLAEVRRQLESVSSAASPLPAASSGATPSSLAGVGVPP
ncbi:unnamed protein product, partial [Scytosiphon promiscuus]